MLMHQLQELSAGRCKQFDEETHKRLPTKGRTSKVEGLFNSVSFSRLGMELLVSVDSSGLGHFTRHFNDTDAS